MTEEEAVEALINLSLTFELSFSIEPDGTVRILQIIQTFECPEQAVLYLNNLIQPPSP